MYKSFKANSLSALITFLNTGNAGGQIVKANIVGVYPDPANGGWIVIYQ